MKEGMKKSEEGEMNRKIRGGQHFDLDHRALVFTFNTAEGILSLTHSTFLVFYRYTPHPLLSLCFCIIRARDTQQFS